MSRKLPGPVAREDLNDLSSPLSLLATRRSSLAKSMDEPGPGKTELSKLFEVALRVPDHGKLTPWRFIVFTDEGREKAGDVLAKRWRELNRDHGAETIEMQRSTFLRAPVVVGVVSSTVASAKIPDWEQELSAGALCQNLLLGAIAMGFGAQWITGWYAYDRDVLAAFGLSKSEKIAGFVYIGTAIEQPGDRPRPDHNELATFWNG